MAKARAAKHVRHKPNVPVVEGHVQVNWEPIEDLRAASWFFPLTVNESDIHNPYHPRYAAREFVSSRIGQFYLEQIVEQQPELADVPLEQLAIREFYPAAAPEALVEAKKTEKNYFRHYSQIVVGLLRIEYGIELSDIVPLYDAGLIPAHDDDVELNIVPGPDYFDFEEGGTTTRVTVKDLLGADLGHLLTSTMIGVKAETVLWPTADVCSKVRELETTGQAYMYGFHLHSTDPEDRDQGGLREPNDQDLAPERLPRGAHPPDRHAGDVCRAIG